MITGDGRQCRACGKWLEQKKGRGRPRKTCNDTCETVYQQALRDHQALRGDLIVRYDEIVPLVALTHGLFESLAEPEPDDSAVKARAHSLAKQLGSLLFPGDNAETVGPALEVLDGGQ